MFSKTKIPHFVTTLTILWAFILSSLPVNAQNVVTSFDLSGGSGALVVRSSMSAKKRKFVATRKRSKARRTVKQRRQTRGKVVRQSRVVAKKSRTRRDINKIAPKEFEKINWRVMEPEKASKVLAGAGEYFVEKGEVFRAAEFLEQAVELDPNNNDAKIALSEAYATLGNEALDKENFKKAKGYFTVAIKYDSKNAASYAGLGQVFDELGEDDNAKANYEKALELDNSFKQVFAPLGIIYYQEGNYEKAEDFIQKALVGEEDNAETLYFLGLLRYLAQDNTAALNAFNKSISLDPENEEAHYYLGATLDRLNRDEEAIASYEKATQIEPRYVNAWYDLGIAYYNQGRFNEAIKAYDKAISLNTNQTEELKTIYSNSFENRGDTFYDLAEKASDLKSKKANLDRANGDYGTVADSRKDDVEFFSKYGIALTKQADVYQKLKLKTTSWENAIKYFEMAVNKDPDAINYTNLGYAYFRLGYFEVQTGRPEEVTQGKINLRQAKVNLKKAIDLSPTFDEAPRVNLGVTLINLEEYDEAIDTLKKVADKKEDWNFINYLIGMTYFKANKLNDASKYLNKAVNKEKNNFDFLSALGDVELKRQNVKEVKKVIDKLKEMGTPQALKKANGLRASLGDRL